MKSVYAKLGAVILTALIVFTAGCHSNRASNASYTKAGSHPRARSPIIPGSVFAPVRSPRPGDISVSILGNVEHPVTHHVPAGTTLYQFLLLVGNFGGKGDLGGRPWTTIILTRKSPDRISYHIPLKTLVSEEPAAWEMKDGDIIFVPEVIL